MTTNLIIDRGRGPEIAGTRITVYTLLLDLLQSDMTETAICHMYDLTPEQVAAARAYVLNNPDTVLSEHLRIEARIANGRAPEDAEKARATKERFQRFKEWLIERERADQMDASGQAHPGGAESIPSFREWMAARERAHFIAPGAGGQI